MGINCIKLTGEDNPPSKAVSVGELIMISYVKGKDLTGHYKWLGDFTLVDEKLLELKAKGCHQDISESNASYKISECHAIANAILNEAYYEAYGECNPYYCGVGACESPTE